MTHMFMKKVGVKLNKVEDYEQMKNTCNGLQYRQGENSGKYTTKSHLAGIGRSSARTLQEGSFQVRKTLRGA